MNTTAAYIVITVIVLAVVALLVFVANKNRKETRFTPLAGLAFGFILAGILFNADRFLGYSMLGIGVILAVIDMFQKSRRK